MVHRQSQKFVDSDRCLCRIRHPQTLPDLQENQYQPHLVP